MPSILEKQQRGCVVGAARIRRRQGSRGNKRQREQALGLERTLFHSVGGDMRGF